MKNYNADFLRSNNSNSSNKFHPLGCNCAGCFGKGNLTDSKNVNQLDGNSHPANAVTTSVNTLQKATINTNDALNALLKGNYSWSGKDGQAAVVTYTFALKTWAYGSESYGATGVELMNSAQKAATVAALNLWSSIANVKFVESNLGNNTNLVFRDAVMPQGIAAWTLPYGTWNPSTGKYIETRADILLDKNLYPNPTVGSYGFLALTHEIGHAMGLSHPGNYNGNVGSGGTAAYDNWDASLMSYYQGANANLSKMPVGPMLYDIAAVQKLYGANTSYNAGDTVYKISGAAQSYAIWDGAGKDTIDSSLVNSDSTIDLREGINNVTKIGASNVWVAFGANIENATGGNGNDTIHGNEFANILNGGNGNDTINGYGGDDNISGGAGNDAINGGDGNDIINGGDGNDTIYGGAGNDNITDTVGINFIFGEAGNDIITTGASNDNINGGDGNDTINAGGGNDIIYGGGGADVFVFSSSAGTDTIKDFVSGTDKIDVIGTVSNIYKTIVYGLTGAHIYMDSGTDIFVEGVKYLAVTDLI